MPEVELIANGQRMTINAAPRLTVMVPQSCIRVDVPAYTEINSRNTIEFMEKMSDRKWVWISSGPLFRALFNEIFENARIDLPRTVAELMKLDYAVIHVAGMIVMCFEAMVERHENVYLRDPENYLHPAQARTIVPVLMKIQALAGETADAPAAR